MNLIIYIESAIAMINLPEICKEAFELSKNNKFTPTSLVFGSDDFCANIGKYYIINLNVTFNLNIYFRCNTI